MNLLILGMPNVGKTSFYNNICSKNDNITHNTIGTTRDWHLSSLKSNININVYDTPGIIFENNKIDKIIRKLIIEVDIILYVVDYKSSNFNHDDTLIKKLRTFGKKIILIINKDDNFKQDKDFLYLGIKDLFYISCSHKLGIKNFINFINKYHTIEKDKQSFDYTIALYGKTNVGKSTLLNKLVGFNRSVVSNIPKTTTDIVSSSFEYKKYKFLIKDTAGLIKKNKIDRDSLDFFVTKKTLSIINQIDINILLIDVEQGFDNQSKKIFNLIFTKSNSLIFLINKIDLIKFNKKNILKNLKMDIENQFANSKNIYILPISALNKKDISNLKNFIYRTALDVKKNISTSKINQWLKSVTIQNPHKRINGREVKFKYATQISDKNLKIKIFSNFTKEISTQYKRFLLNNFHKYFKIKSKNVKLLFSKSNNPYN
tara:strand:+ start:978 stop:2267 length:1290 start_codon:yes stop_codon:yes gene_type:complete